MIQTAKDKENGDRPNCPALLENESRKGNIKVNEKNQTTVLKSQRGWKLRGTRYWGE